MRASSLLALALKSQRDSAFIASENSARSVMARRRHSRRSLFARRVASPSRMARRRAEENVARAVESAAVGVHSAAVRPSLLPHRGLHWRDRRGGSRRRVPQAQRRATRRPKREAALPKPQRAARRRRLGGRPAVRRSSVSQLAGAREGRCPTRIAASLSEFKSAAARRTVQLFRCARRGPPEGPSRPLENITRRASLDRIQATHLALRLILSRARLCSLPHSRRDSEALAAPDPVTRRDRPSG